MSFITLHQENGFCGYEMSLINAEQVASVTPVVGTNKWFARTSNACLRLNDGRCMNVRETVAAILGLLEEAKIVRKNNTGEAAARVTSIDELKQKIAMAW